MDTSTKMTLRILCLGFLSTANVGLAQSNDSSNLWPFPKANYTYPTTGHTVVDPADEDSDAGAWRYPAHAQPPVVASDFSVAGFDVSAAPNDLEVDHMHATSTVNHPAAISVSACGCEKDIESACGCCPGHGWFGSVSGLLMTREAGSSYQFSFDNEPLGSRDPIHLLDIREAEMGLSGGFDTRIGHYFGDGQLAVELVYWGLYPSVEESVLTPAGFVGVLDTLLNFDRVSINGTGVNFWTSDSDAHRVRRDFDVHNAEFNLLNFRGCTVYDQCGCPRFGFSWGAGFRFFHFTEDLTFSARENGGGVNFDDGQAQIDYSVEVNNNLFGGQVGGEGRWFASDNLSLTVSGKVGVFANSIRHRSRIEDEQGNVAVVNDGPLTGSAWNVDSSKGEVALLAELNVGLNYCLTEHLSLIAGYRLLGVSGVALSAEQIPNDLRQVNDAYVIDSDSGLLFHGGFAGLEFLY